MTSYLAGMTAAQLKAAQTFDGPLMILAGAGTGKTRTLISRLACLETRAGIDASRLLALTFTAKAAEEMRSRLAALSLPGADPARIRICTIHALCLEILKQHGQKIGMPANFSLVTPACRAALIRQAAAAVGPDSSSQMKKLDLQISREKNAESGYAGFSAVGQAYQQLLESLGLLDFDDLILKTSQLFAAAPEALEAMRGRSARAGRIFAWSVIPIRRFTASGALLPIFFCAFKQIIRTPCCCGWKPITAQVRLYWLRPRPSYCKAPAASIKP